MRSHLIHMALVQIENRFMLCRMASLATRKGHSGQGRVQDTINSVMGRLGAVPSNAQNGQPAKESLPAA